MRRVTLHMDEQALDRTPDFHRHFQGRFLEVRDVLAELRGSLSRYAPVSCDVATAEIVLAEVLNNIVEHGYQSAPGPVELRIWVDSAGLTFVVTDAGAPLPGGRPPARGARRLPGDPGVLPESGFGWHLIHSLTDELDYDTRAGRNRLRGRVPAHHPRLS